MTESQIGFLYKVAQSFPHSETNQNLTLLRSYYLTRCKEITKGYGLPEKQFSTKVRCSHCCIEWRKGTQTKVKCEPCYSCVVGRNTVSDLPKREYGREFKVRCIKLSKKQRRKIRLKKACKLKKGHLKSRQDLLNCNEMEQICTFCKQSTITPIVKPGKEKIEPIKRIEKTVEIAKVQSSIKKVGGREVKSENKEVNVYSYAKDIFSLKNTKNNLATAVKEKQKINNNKKKKDKFAGLCQKAVLASAKLKDADKKQDKLSLFLRPSL